MKEYLLKYDQEADAVYVRLEKKRVADTVEIKKDVFADLDSRGKVIGIELLSFSKKKLGLNDLISKGLENILVVR